MWPSCRRNTSTMRSRLEERFPPGGTAGIGEFVTNSPILANVRVLFDAEGLAAAAGRRGVRVLDRESAAGDRIDEIDFGAVQVADADRVDEQLHAVRFVHLIAGALAVFLDHEAVLEARAAAALHEHAKSAAGLVLFR